MHVLKGEVLVFLLHSTSRILYLQQLALLRHLAPSFLQVFPGSASGLTAMLTSFAARRDNCFAFTENVENATRTSTAIAKLRTVEEKAFIFLYISNQD